MLLISRLPLLREQWIIPLFPPGLRTAGRIRRSFGTKDPLPEFLQRRMPAFDWDLPDGSLCAYCCDGEALFGPPGFYGPLCLACGDFWREKGAGAIFMKRYHRWHRAFLGALAAWKRQPLITNAAVVFQDESFAVHVASYVVQVTDGTEEGQRHCEAWS